MKRTALFGLIIMFMITLHSTVAADTVKNKTASDWKEIIADSDDLFSDWKGASVRKLFAETTDTKQPVTVWTVEQGQTNLGYFVVTNDGKSLMEYSPITPVQFRVQRQAGTYDYAGPGMHLFQENGNNAALVNLSNGEQLPAGIVAEHVPDSNKPQLIQSETRNFDTNTSPENGVSVMIQHGLGQSVPFETAALNQNPKGGYLVFTALETDYYSVLAVKGVTDLQGQPMFKVHDVFAGSAFPFYIRSDVPVNWVGSK